MSIHTYNGSCHCGAVGYVYRTALLPNEWNIRECQCSFCRAHAALSTSDSAGSLEFVESTDGALTQYRFALRTADFLICGRCGVYIGATIATPKGKFGIINARILLETIASLPKPGAATYEGETAGERAARRALRWTPVVGPPTS